MNSYNTIVNHIDIEANRKAVKYSKTELLARILWGAGSMVFRLSPRLAYGFRSALLRLFGAKVGRHVQIHPRAEVFFPWNLDVGDHTSIGDRVMIYSLGPVSIGQRATISQRAHICAGSHDYTDPQMELLKPPIRIGNDVWVCTDAFVGPGLEVGDGAVVGARSVVTRSVPEWTVVAGNPARPIKPRELK